MTPLSADRPRHARRLLLGIVCAAVAFGSSDVLLLRTVSASQDDSLASNFGLYNGSIYAAADREQVGTSTNPEFTAGAVNNFYPLAHAAVATAGTSAAASPADTGPFAQAVIGGGTSGNGVTQPQYVYAQYPGQQSPKPISAGPVSASASVTPASATAAGAAGPVAPPASSQQTAADQSLATVLSQWRAKFLSLQQQASAPQPAASEPDGLQGYTASDTVFFDTAKGFTTTGVAFAHHASFGGGQIVVDDVSVHLTLSNPGDGSPLKPAVSISVGGVTVGGVPVTVSDSGVTVSTQQIVSPSQAQQATQQLNAALAAAGFSVHLVTPVQTQQGDSLHVEAAGLQVAWTQPPAPSGCGPCGGVPSQFVVHTLGTVIADNEAMLSSSSLSAALPPLSAGTGAIGPGGAGAGPAVSAAASPPAKAAGTRPAGGGSAKLASAPRPTWLLLLYLAWQALLIGTAASIYLWRSGMRLPAWEPT